MSNKNNINIISLNPNFKYVETITQLENNTCNEPIETIEIYYPSKIKNELYLIIPDNTKSLIIIMRLLDQKKISSLKHSSYRITRLRHFFNPINTFDYLISLHEECFLHLWDLSNNFKLKYIINVDYKIFSISDCIILFEYNYIITSTIGKNYDNFSKIYSFDKNGKFIKNIKNTDSNWTFTLIKWIDKYKTIYIIECCNNKIYCYDIMNEDNYFELKTNLHESKHYNGYIVKKNNNDYFWSISVNGYINIWGLNNRKFEGRIFCGFDYVLRDIIQWNENYMIVCEEKSKFFVVDIQQKKIISLYKFDNGGVLSVKKLNHPYYGASLLTMQINSEIKLFNTIKTQIINIKG